MAIRDDFTAGEVLAAADLNDTFASKPPFAYGTATPSTTVEGFIWYDENSTPPLVKFWDGSAFESIGGGKILQVVRATDGTLRTTTSTTYVDANLSVTITPQKSTSAIILLCSFLVSHNSGSGAIRALTTITDSSNNAISGAEESRFGIFSGGPSGLSSSLTLIGYATPGTTAAKTYKLRFAASSAAIQIDLINNIQTAQLFAIEVSA